ncbi:MAG: sulfotransferase, partial [Flavobacteriaceae bacterium]
LKSLGEHPEFDKASAVGEAPFISSFFHFLKDFEETSPNASYNTKNYRKGQIERQEIFRGMIEKLHTSGSAVDKKYWTSKISLNMENYRFFEEIFPDFGVIYIIRNGIEVVNSARKFTGFMDRSFSDLCRRWQQSLARSAFLERSPRCALIRHEDLISNPSDTMSGAFIHLGVTENPGPGNFIDSTIFNSSFSASSSNVEGNSAQTLAHRRVEAWESWSREERQTFLDVCGEEMRRHAFAIPQQEAWRQSGRG